MDQKESLLFLAPSQQVLKVRESMENNVAITIFICSHPTDATNHHYLTTTHKSPVLLLPRNIC